jgi:membrane associated rhomboid family serine protease
MLGYWFLQQLLSAVLSIGQNEGGVAFGAHVGGFVTGIVLVKLFCRASRLEVCSRKKGVLTEFLKKVP